PLGPTNKLVRLVAISCLEQAGSRKSISRHKRKQHEPALGTVHRLCSLACGAPCDHGGGSFAAARRLGTRVLGVRSALPGDSPALARSLRDLACYRWRAIRALYLVAQGRRQLRLALAITVGQSAFTSSPAPPGPADLVRRDRRAIERANVVDPQS